LAAGVFGQILFEFERTLLFDRLRQRRSAVGSKEQRIITSVPLTRDPTAGVIAVEVDRRAAVVDASDSGMQ